MMRQMVAAALRAKLPAARSEQSGRPDLNRGPHRPERCALPGCATPRRAWSLATSGLAHRRPPRPAPGSSTACSGRSGACQESAESRYVFSRPVGYHWAMADRSADRERRSPVPEDGERFRREGDEAAPESPTKLPKRSWLAVLKRTGKECSDDNLTDWPAALTYYGVLAIFPALIALVSILGLVGQSATQPLIDNLGQVAPRPAQQIFTGPVQGPQRSRGAPGLLFFVGI